MSSLSTSDYANALGRRVARFAVSLMVMLFIALTLIAARASARSVAAAAPVVAPGPGSVEEAVEALVDDALAANLELDGAGATVAERLAALDQARAQYLPSLDFSSRYTRADGGRTIDFPVGDLLNPVYASLNQLTGSSRFPAVANQEINFQRSREQDTKVSLTQPLYDPRISATRGWIVRVGLADRDAVRIKPEDSARIEFDAWPGQVFNGRVSNIASAADAVTGTFESPFRDGHQFDHSLQS